MVEIDIHWHYALGKHYGLPSERGIWKWKCKRQRKLKRKRKLATKAKEFVRRTPSFLPWVASPFWGPISGRLITIRKLLGIHNREKVRPSGNNQNQSDGKSLQSGYRDKLRIGKTYSKSFDADVSPALSGSREVSLRHSQETISIGTKEHSERYRAIRNHT